MKHDNHLGVWPDVLYTLDAISELLGLSKRTLSDIVNSGELKSVKKHGRRYVLGVWVIEYFTKE